MAEDIHYELRFCGSGGQGLMLLGEIVAQAAGCVNGLKVLLTKSYGPEARGTACRSELIITSRLLFELSVKSPDLMVALSQTALDKFDYDLKSKSLLLIDSGLKQVTKNDSAVTLKIPFTEISYNCIGNPSQVNMVALGSVAFFMPLLDRQSFFLILNNYIQERKIFKESLAAFKAGYEYTNMYNNKSSLIF